MSSARRRAAGSRGIVAAAVLALGLFPVAGIAACPHADGGRAVGSSSASAHGKSPAARPALAPAAVRATEMVCVQGAQQPMCELAPAVDPSPAEPSEAPAASASPETVTPPSTSEASGGAASPSARPDPGTPTQRERPRTVFVPRLIEIVRERPAVAASIAGGLVIGVGLMTLFLLASRRRRREEELVAEEAARQAYGSLTSSFLSHLSHELYTPLTPVRAYAAILKRNHLDPAEVEQVADQMLEASGKLERVFEVLVALADVRRGEPNTQHDVVDATKVIHSAVARVPEPRRDAIWVSVDPALPDLMANERLLELAVAALVDNAAKFSEGKITVRADLRGAPEDRELLRIRVSDRGIGMTADQLRVAMDAFRQIDGSLARPYGGLGIGLALVDQVARAHGGRIVASSRPGRGSTFTLTIPLVPAAHGIPVSQAGTKRSA